ncbi:MAG: hypothetical protein ACYDAC_08410 [Candidatus Dormibacteria bacterium]
MRTVVVLGRNQELAVALRERLDRAWTTVLDASGEDPLATCRACVPWPFMVAGDAGSLPEGLGRWLRRRPVLVRWLGELPPGLPRHARALLTFAELAASVNAALKADVGGVRLAVGTGVQLGDAVHRNAELEALLGDSPLPLALPRSRFRGAESLLSRRAPRLRIVASPTGISVAAR